MEEFRNRKLAKLITHCYENVPYYRRLMDNNKVQPRDIQHAEDLNKLPILTKEVLRTCSNKLITRNISKMGTAWSKSGGTTGEPIQVCKSSDCAAWESMCYERGLRWGGLDVDEPRIALFGGSLGIDKARFTDKIGKILRHDLFLPAFELRSDTAPGYFNRIRRSKYRFLVGYTSAIYRLAMLAQEMNQEIEFKAVFPTAELVLPDWEEVIRKVFNCKVLPYYGCGEVNSLGYYKSESEGYLIPEEHALIEVLRGDGSTQLMGEGAFIVTDLDNYAMPIIRYANGDAGKVSGPDNRSPFARIQRLDGRYNSLLLTDTGDLISGAIGPHVFRHMESVETYRIIQEEPLRLVITIVPKDNFSERDESLIVTLFAKHLGSRMKITIEKVSSLPVVPSGKSVFVLNRCLEDRLSLSPGVY